MVHPQAALRAIFFACLLLAGGRADAAAAQSAKPGLALQCLDVVVEDARGAAAARVLLEAHGPNGVRVRAVPSGFAIRDDLVSAFATPPAIAAIGGGHGPRPGCTTRRLVAAGAPGGTPAPAPASVTNGNLKAAVGADGRLTFTRVSDGKVLLQEKAARSFAPANTTLPGFLTLDLEFEPVDGERIYGLGQHKTGKLDNKNAGRFKLAPANTEILIPVVHSSIGCAALALGPGRPCSRQHTPIYRRRRRRRLPAIQTCALAPARTPKFTHAAARLHSAHCPPHAPRADTRSCSTCLPSVTSSLTTRQAAGSRTPPSRPTSGSPPQATPRRTPCPHGSSSSRRTAPSRASLHSTRSGKER